MRVTITHDTFRLLAWHHWHEVCGMWMHADYPDQMFGLYRAVELCREIDTRKKAV